jgi:hypothetical protein
LPRTSPNRGCRRVGRAYARARSAATSAKSESTSTRCSGTSQCTESVPPNLDALHDALLDHGRCDGRGLAPKTILKIHQILRASLGDACRRGLLLRYEALLAHPPVLRARYSNKPSAWTATQLAEVLSTSSGHRLWLRLAGWLALGLDERSTRLM